MVDIRGENNQFGSPERWLAAGEPLIDFPRIGREEKIYLAASVDALQHGRAVSVSGTGVINGQQRQSWDVWPTLCGLLFYFRGGEVESCSGLFSEARANAAVAVW